MSEQSRLDALSVEYWQTVYAAGPHPAEEPMSDNVFTLPGAEKPVHGPDPYIIETLEKWLADAREGRLVAVALAGTLAGNGARCSAWSTPAAYENNLAASVMALNFRFGQFLWMIGGDE